MYDISTDETANRLYIDLTGRLSAAEIEDAADESVRAGKTLEDGFDIITDLSGFKPPSPEAAGPIKRAQKQLKEMSLDRVIRVIDDETNEIVIHAFERRSKDVGYSGETADSVTEAERHLANSAIDGFGS